MKWLILIIVLPFLLLVGGLLLNRPPLLDPPGPLERLKVYFTKNVAETRPDHSFPELRALFVPADVGKAREAVLAAMTSFGWQDVQEGDREILAVVVTPLFRFRDDVVVRLEPANEGTLIHGYSASRVGKGDLAANANHLQQLFSVVEQRIGRP